MYLERYILWRVLEALEASRAQCAESMHWTIKAFFRYVL